MKKRRNAFKLMSQMITLVAPLKIYMLFAIILGTAGFLLSFGLGIFGGYALASLIDPAFTAGFSSIPFGGHSFKWYVYALIICAVLRGILHYVEQFCNHFIAFKILAEVRHKVFNAMRRLAPAKLEGENQGKLISIIMGDIELLEVFYAHTISPIFIAATVTVCMFLFYARINIYVALLALVSQLFVGVVIPVIASKKASDVGVEIRNDIGMLNGKFLDELRGIREIIQYDGGEKAIEEIDKATEQTCENQGKLKKQVADLQGKTDTAIIVFSVIQAVLCGNLIISGSITPIQGFIAVLTQLSTFAPYIALANLGTTLSQTFACGERVLSLLEEEPEVKKVVDGKDVVFESAEISNLGFAYDKVEVLKDINFDIKKGETLGIMGKSGSGKSTVLKLLMRFWDSDKGSICINGINLKDINTDSIYDNIDYMTQTTVLFSGTIRDNLKIAKNDATDEEIMEALKKASIDDYIKSLKDGLDTRVSDLGDNFSGGERQRIGLARCFMTDSKIILLDEPTSNLDSQNEAIILKSLVEESDDKTIVLVSHRESTMGVCDRILHMKDGKFIAEIDGKK